MNQSGTRRESYPPHPELPTGVADPPRMKLWQSEEVVGTEVGNFLGACSPDPELDRGTLEHPRLSPIGPLGRGARL